MGKIWEGQILICGVCKVKKIVRIEFFYKDLVNFVLILNWWYLKAFVVINWLCVDKCVTVCISTDDS